MTSWELLRETAGLRLRRRGRFLVADLRVPQRVLSTSVCNGGQVEHVQHLVNHQSCEGTGHQERYRAITEHGQEAYHARACAEVDLPPERTALMGTAANMNYAALSVLRDGALEVLALVTAGVQTNAACAGDPAGWREGATGTEKVPVPGTINTLLCINLPLTPGALARAVVTMTEAKSAALQRLAVPSCYSVELATGTGTDQYCLAAPLAGEFTLSSASPHVKLGELIGVSVRTATLEALRWQNGLEASFTRGLFHVLGRYGVSEDGFADALATRLDPEDAELLRRNLKAVCYEPLVAAAAHALATVLDRTRHGTLPCSVAREAALHQAATLAASLATRPEQWPLFHARLQAVPESTPAALVLDAVALGWRAKWRPL